MCDYNRTDAERDDDREAMADEHAGRLGLCVVCDRQGCTDAIDCGCYHRAAGMFDGNPVHLGLCLELYRESQATMAALAVAVGR